VLGDNTHTYVYGHQRLLAVQGDTRIWHLHDALGSLRMTLDSTGTPQSLHSYDAWGVVQEGTPAPFGFTGEMQQAGLVYLRARWYAAGSGTFTSRDPFAGYAQQPYSLHPYQYAYSDPLLWTDPSGRCIPGVHPDCTPVYECFVWEPGCRPLQFDEFNWADATPWGGAAVDATPIVGDAKGLIEVFTGCDLVTGEDLGWWRLAGIIGLSELRHLRHADDAYTWVKHADGVIDDMPVSRRKMPESGGGGGSAGRVTTPGGRNLSIHAETDSLRRHGFQDPFNDIDDIIDNYSRITTQQDGATVYIKKVGRRGDSYAIVILNEDTNTIITAIKGLDKKALKKLGQNYGFNPNP
jgi:RHS repeat-associated protein